MSNFLVFAAISTPELVMGASLLSLFVSGNTPRGTLTITIAHVLFSLSFVVVTVRARVVGLDPSMEEAARDLGAGPWTTFRLVTLPAIMPGVLAGALLAFALSVDDYVVTSFVNGSTLTFPLWIMGAVKVGIPPQVNVMGTLIFGIGVAIAIANAIASGVAPEDSGAPRRAARGPGIPSAARNREARSESGGEPAPDQLTDRAINSRKLFKTHVGK
nr:hypothetical protein GCM10020093_100160 [Planobispora longispora]